MAKSRVNVKGVSKAVAQLTKDLKKMQKQPVQASKSDTDALHRRLTDVRELLNSCPDPMFNMFAAAEEPIAAARPRRKGAKKTRKGTRKVR